MSICYSPDGFKLITGSSNNKIKVWELCIDHHCNNCKYESDYCLGCVEGYSS